VTQFRLAKTEGKGSDWNSHSCCVYKCTKLYSCAFTITGIIEFHGGDDVCKIAAVAMN